jgi:CheY-like chemotaxis protein
MAERPTIPLERKYVLVVEDNLDVRQIISQILRIEGYEVLEAQDGLEALQIIASHNINLILSDIHMPNLNGFELAKYIKQTPTRSHIPIVFVSSSYSLDDIQKAQTIGIQEYLIKPVNPDDLIIVVNKITGFR